MPEPTKIPRPFADSGDKNSIPDSSGGLGFASWQEGFPAITGTPFAQGGVAPKRADFNGIFNALSLATLWQQQGGFYAYDATTDYEIGNVVEYNNDLYKCLSANGPSSAVIAPTDTTVWSKVMTAADAAALYLPLSTITDGTWTPTLAGATVNGTATYSTRKGSYIKIGNFVYVTGEVEGAFSVLPTGRVVINGLPYSGTKPEQASIVVYGYSGGVANSLSRMIRGSVFTNFIRVHCMSSRDTSATGCGKSDWGTWSSTSNDTYYMYLTLSDPNFHIYFAGSYLV